MNQVITIMKRTNPYLREILAAAILFVVIGSVVNSCIECEKRVSAFLEQCENERRQASKMRGST